jgi:hypothetical protein
MADSDVKFNQLPIPDAALRDSDAVEMLRVWIAERGLHCSLKAGMWREIGGAPEEKAWGMVLVDAARHIANALASGYGADAAQSLDLIKQSFLNELGAPTSDAKGDFVRKH